jgi:hypothetical protein
MANTPASNTPNGAPEGPKPVFEKVLTATPVLLTIVATFLVGQASSEMTQAQYHRAAAGQNQSKVGDQWAFFQAKRIRGTSYEMTADLIATFKEPEPFTKETLPRAANSLAAELRAAQKTTDVLVKSGKGTATAKELARFQETTKQLAGKATELANEIATALNPPPATTSAAETDKKNPLTVDAVKAALAALGREDTKPKKKTEKPKQDEKAKETERSSETDMAAQELAKVNQAVDAIRKRKSEKEVAALVMGISDNILHEAIAKADEKADKVSKRGKQVENVLEQFDKLTDRLNAVARDFLVAYRNLTREASPGGDKDEASRREWTSLEHQAQAIRRVSDQLRADYKAARHAFTARRYEDDARSNQDSAYLYEIKAYLSGARSDRHLTRSRNFLYAMLAAQAGVTIATLAMAVRQKSIMWLLATLAGLIAIGFGVYVYLGLD